MPTIDQLEWFLKTATIQGLGFMALALFILVCLWGFWEIMRLAVRGFKGLVDWVPKWFSSQVDLHISLKQGIDAATGTLTEIHEKVAKTNEGVQELLVIHRERDHD